MAQLANVELTISQSDSQRRLALALLTYRYRLTCTDVEVERGVTFEISIDVLGEDPLRDEALAERVDVHLVEASAEPVAVERELLVGQSLLDEDIGRDEVKVRVRVGSDAGDVIDAVSGVVRGQF